MKILRMRTKRIVKRKRRKGKMKVRQNLSSLRQEPQVMRKVKKPTTFIASISKEGHLVNGKCRGGWTSKCLRSSSWTRYTKFMFIIS